MSVTPSTPTAPPHAPAAAPSPGGVTPGVSPLEVIRQLPATVVAFLAVIAAAIAIIAWPTLIKLVHVWNVDPDYSHGFLVIPASLVFCGVAWNRWQAQRQTQVKASPAPRSGGLVTGGAEIVLGLLLHWVGLLFDVPLVDVVGLICLLRGTVLLVAGEEFNRAMAFPVLFLIFMAPLPPSMQQSIALFMQQMVAIVSAGILDLFNMRVFREGYIIHLAHEGAGTLRMEVGEACSGMRSMTALLALSLAIAFLLNGSRGYWWLLALCGLSAAIVANIIRVVMCAPIMVFLGKQYAEGTYHQAHGLVLEGAAAVVLVIVAFALLKFTSPAKT
jgi:exosortase